LTKTPHHRYSTVPLKEKLPALGCASLCANSTLPRALHVKFQPVTPSRVALPITNSLLVITCVTVLTKSPLGPPVPWDTRTALGDFAPHWYSLTGTHMSNLISNCGAAPREQCAGVDFLSHTCVVCGGDFVPRQYNQVTCGAVGCRFGRQRRAIRALEHASSVERGWKRRRAKSLVDFLSQTRGTKARDSYKEAKVVVKDKEQSFSRCSNCNTDFELPDGKKVTSPSQFCSKVCREAWIEAHPIRFALPEKKQLVRDAVDEERLANGKRIHAPKVLRMPRTYKSFCPTCVEVVVDPDGKEVRRTIGMYRAVEHDCGEVSQLAA